MADCLGRFGRASHSTSRYHTTSQIMGQVQMHVQCKAFNAGNAFSALQCGFDLARSMFSRRHRRSISHHPPPCGLPFARPRTSNATWHGVQTESLQASYRATRPWAQPSSAIATFANVDQPSESSPRGLACTSPHSIQQVSFDTRPALRAELVHTMQDMLWQLQASLSWLDASTAKPERSPCPD